MPAAHTNSITAPHMQPSARGSKTRTKRKYFASYSFQRSIKRKFSSLGEEEKKEWKKNVPLSGENFLHHRLNHIFPSDKNQIAEK